MKANIPKIIRGLHRDIGFIVIGLTVLFSVSGVVLIYRDTDAFTYEKKVKETIAKDLSRTKLYDEIPLRRLNFGTDIADTVFFQQGFYIKTTGELNYSYRTYPWLIRKFNFFHRSISREATHFIATIYSVLLLFLALSSFWMYPPKSKYLKRGLLLSAIGVAGVIILLFFL